MIGRQKTVIVTGASQGIGAGVVRAFLERGYNVVGTARNASSSTELRASDHLALIDGDIGSADTAARVARLAIMRFGSIDVLVANAGIFMVKPFIEYTAEDLRSLVSTNVSGFVHIAQLAVRQMLEQRSGGSVVSVTSSLVKNPIGGVTASLPMITKGGLEAVVRSLAAEYAGDRIRFNAVAPGIVDTPLHASDPKEFLRSLSPMGTISSVTDVAEAIVYLSESQQVTGEVLHVDGGAHNGKW